jgi:2-oxoglutarate dehydrogenase E2 component (dihydrolipoamide succinyltransferase)
VARPATPAPSIPAPQANAGDKIRSSPLVRRIAKDNNLDLSRIAGTGSEGRITKEDILSHLNEQRPGISASATQPQGSPLQVPGDLVPLSKMRAIIAQRMVESLVISPHVHSVFKVDMTRIVRIREREKAAFEQRHGVKLTYMPFIAAVVIDALRKFPIVNASLENGSIRYHDHIHLGIAVALEWGLIVPVAKQAETQSFVELARAIADLAARARTKKLKPDEASGSTFTLTNSGIFGEEFGTPIINQPESAILAIGGLKKEAVVLTDAEGNDTIAIRSMQHICLGFDHRTIDGADAGKFMAELKKTLENWNQQIG